MPNDKKIKIRIDPEKCMGCATCSVLFPEVFAYDEVSGKSAVREEMIDEDTLASVLRMCPAGAIQKVE